MPPQLRRRRAFFRFRLPIISYFFPNHYVAIPLSRTSLMDFLVTSAPRLALYFLGPVLVLVTFGLVYFLSYTFWYVILPLEFGSYYTLEAVLHQTFVVVVICNIIFNYYSCVTTSNFKCTQYDTVVRELARATSFDYPQNQQEIDSWKVQWRETILERARQKRLQTRYNAMSKYGLDEESMTADINNASKSNSSSLDTNRDQIQTTNEIKQGDTTATTLIPPANAQPSTSLSHANENLKRRNVGVQPEPAGPVRSWMFLGPYDWSYCDRTGVPKPPRSHYDHVTKALVLNMDHYCPWMFNVVGYFNYRYFCNFLIYVAIGMTYGALITYQPFMMIDSDDYHKQIIQSRKDYLKVTGMDTSENSRNIHIPNFRYSHVKHLIPHVPIPLETTPIAVTFMMCLAVGIAVMMLLAFHIYLIATAQTTIEFHGNRMKKARCEDRGEVFCNPYDMGTKRNVEQVWGTWRGDGWIWFWTALLPSRRENEFLPIPFKGDGGRRDRWGENVYNEDNEEDIGLLMA